MVKRGLVIFGCLCLAALIVYLLIVKSGVLKNQETWEEMDPGIPIVSTRGHFEGGTLTPGHTVDDYDLVDPKGEGPFWEVAPQDIMVVVHGFNNTPEKASVKFRTAVLSLESCGYAGRIVGFSWDANTQKDRMAMTGYHEGRRHAVGNGLKLARFLSDCREVFPGCRLHVIGYSMGARTVLEALVACEGNTLSGLEGPITDTVHLVGAAVDNEEVETRERYGKAIEKWAGWVFNYYSREDNALGVFYPLKEGDRALGEADIEHAAFAPENYSSCDVSSELIRYDDALNVLEDETGDNHSACLGNLGPDGQLLDDGIINIVVSNINQIGGSSKEK